MKVVRWFQGWQCDCTYLGDERPPEKCPEHDCGPLGIHGIPELVMVDESLPLGVEAA